MIVEIDRWAVEVWAATSRKVFSKETLNRWCGVCGGELHVEHGRTKFRTMEEALPQIKAIEEANLRTRSIIGGKF
ncbi:MAG TPA: hypothetical protein VMX96_00255 [Dehalococcoidia bacterium]|nr:hypothetical protein [Dehalococcoidia bacterium]